MCKHTKVWFQETIQAFHQRFFDENGYYCNNEYGNRISVSVGCSDCGIQRSITYGNKDKQPKWVQTRIEAMKIKGDWFFSN